jgi:hypothetical protein
LVKYFENQGTMRVQGWQIKNFEEKGHHILTHDGGIKTKLDAWMSHQFCEEIFKVRAIIVVMHFYLTERISSTLF